MVLVIDQRGVVKVLKHRYVSAEKVKAEVTLTVTETRSELYSSDEKATLALTAPVPLSRRVAVGRENIENLLRDAARRAYPVAVTGVKANGESYTHRVIHPRGVGVSYVNFEDPDDSGDGVKSFRLDGIKRAEVLT